MTTRGMHQEELLRNLGHEVRRLREARGLTRRELARASGLSERFLAELEGGAANISVLRLQDVAVALGRSAAALLEAGRGEPGAGRSGPAVVSLLGLRGAGKSSVGAALGRRLAVPFFELSELVEAQAGMPLDQIFELQGERYFRRLERETLARFLVDHRSAVLAPSGGIVTEPDTYGLLLRHTVSVWLKASPRDHWSRVVAQGDRRPMANRSAAMEELKELIAAREPLYARADLVIDTGQQDVEGVAARIAGRLASLAPRRDAA